MTKTEQNDRSLIPTSVLTKNQKKTFRVDTMEDGMPMTIIAEVRHDDEYGNGHNSFAITAEIYGPDVQRGELTVTHESGKKLWCHSGGCCHDEVAKYFPQLAPLLKWHLTSTDQPMHYVSNAAYLASERDHWGCLKGEPHQWSEFIRFGTSPISHKLSERFAKFIKERHGSGDFQIIPIAHQNTAPLSYKFEPKYTFAGYGEKWHECPFDDLNEAQEWQKALRGEIFFDRIPVSFGEGKERDLDGARSAAVWPDATDEDLISPGLEQRLIDRLPALMAEFKAAVESLGFVY